MLPCAPSALYPYDPANVIGAFLQAQCTLLVPTFSWSFAVPPPDQRFPRNGWDYAAYAGPTAGLGRIYTPQTTDIDNDMGALAAAIARHPQRVRGQHPLCSFSALGRHATDLIRLQRPDDVYAPLTQLARRKGFVLLIGVGFDKLTLLHLAEKVAGRRLFRRWANSDDGRPIAVEVGGCSTMRSQAGRSCKPENHVGSARRSRLAKLPTIIYPQNLWPDMLVGGC